MKSWRRVLVLLVLSLGGSALACSCRKGGDVLPRAGSTNVPTNVVIRVLYNFAPAAEDFSLTRVGGAQVPLTFRDGPGEHVWSLAPTSKLEASTQYELTIPGAAPQRFTTGTQEDHEAPTQPKLGASAFKATSSWNSCGDTRTWDLAVTGGEDASEVVLLMHSSGSTEPTQAIGATSLVEAQLRTGLCSPNFKAPDGSSFPLAVQAMDLAGNVSEVSTTRTERGCTSAPGGALLGLGLALFKRRRRM